MSCSRALRWFLLLLLPLTLGWKLVVLHSINPNEPTETPEDRVAGFLVSHQFNVIRVKKYTGEMQVVRATDGACNVLVAVTSARGWHRDMVRQLTKPSDQTFVVFRGSVYSQQPMVLTVTEFLWFKLLNQVGLNVQLPPVLAVIATKNCGAEKLPWRELR